MTRQNRLLEVINFSNICLSEKNNLTVINAKPNVPYGSFTSADLALVQPFATFFDELVGFGYKVFAEMTQNTDVSIVHIPKSKIEGFGSIANAIKMTNNHVIVDGNKKDGIDSYLKKINKLTEILNISIKNHGKAFSFDPKQINEHILIEWETNAEIQKNSDNFFTAEGMFSSKMIDKGSYQLAAFFKNMLKGRVADLGAGWGWLSFEALKQNIDKIDLFEGFYPSMQSAKLNINDPRATFFWIDVLKISAKKQYDIVIMNPPFHLGQASDPSLGNNFIKKAAEILNRNGTLLMVANRQLPYEKNISKLFKSVTINHVQSGFKIIQAKKPKV
jgi:16S rRNA (guanine1207-N2)-methyltransferase